MIHFEDPTPGELSQGKTARLDSYDVSALGEVLTLEEVQTIAAYQRDASVPTLFEAPVPVDIESSNPLGASMLRQNLATYEDEVEDAIAKDPKVEDLLHGPDVLERGAAIRARRSTIAFLLHHGIAEPLVEVQPAETSSADDPDDHNGHSSAA